MAEHDEPTVEQLNDEADIAADYLEGLLDVLDYDGDIEMGVRNGRAVVQIVADDDTDIRNLTGKEGEVVEALQRLTRLAVQQKTGNRSRLILDVDGFLKKKRAGLNEVAMDAVDEARSSGEPVDLDPMNSFERKIVHDVARSEGLKSRSHGEEPHRYVTVYVRGANNAASGDDVDDDDAADDNGSDRDFEEGTLDNRSEQSDSGSVRGGARAGAAGKGEGSGVGGPGRDGRSESSADSDDDFDNDDEPDDDAEFDDEDSDGEVDDDELDESDVDVDDDDDESDEDSDR